MTNGTQTCGTRNGVGTLTPIGTLFERLLDGDFFAPVAAKPAAPLAVWQDEHAIFVEMDAPGVTADGVSVTVHNKELTVQLTRAGQKREDGIDTRLFGTFEQRLKLPTLVDDGRVDATLANGVLRVTLPKSEQAKPRKIEVKAG
jgi:HSP20 family protein